MFQLPEHPFILIILEMHFAISAGDNWAGTFTRLFDQDLKIRWIAQMNSNSFKGVGIKPRDRNCQLLQAAIQRVSEPYSLFLLRDEEYNHKPGLLPVLITANPVCFKNTDADIEVAE